MLTASVGVFVLSVLLPISGDASQKKWGKKPHSAPETFNAKARVATAASTGEALLTIDIKQYTAQRDIQAMEQALKSGGSAGFLDALRRAPVVGEVKVGPQTFSIRWARERPTERGRVISLVTDAPVYFVGAGVVGAKSRAGFDLAVLQLTMDSSGIGQGTMAAAARVKPGGPTGVEVEDYGTEPVKLTSISRVIP
jgi:hypothetical protein